MVLASATSKVIEGGRDFLEILRNHDPAEHFDDIAGKFVRHGSRGKGGFGYL